MAIDLEAARQRIPILLDQLEEMNPEKAAFIKDVYSEVLFQLRQKNVRDVEFVQTLVEALDYAFAEVRVASSIFEQISALVEGGVDVMIHGRATDSARNAETRRWAIEIDQYPVCFAGEYDGDLRMAFQNSLKGFCELQKGHLEIH